jgi:hypothetical protein
MNLLLNEFYGCSLIDATFCVFGFLSSSQFHHDKSTHISRTKPYKKPKLAKNSAKQLTPASSFGQNSKADEQ